MKRKKDHYTDAVNILIRLKKSYPKLTLGQHIDTALSDYTDVWSISDKEFLFAIEKYEHELEIDHNVDLNIDEIIEDGKNLTFNEDEYFDEDNF